MPALESSAITLVFNPRLASASIISLSAAPIFPYPDFWYLAVSAEALVTIALSIAIIHLG
jgi:hypothetical protein